MDGKGGVDNDFLYLAKGISEANYRIIGCSSDFNYCYEACYLVLYELTGNYIRRD